MDNDNVILEYKSTVGPEDFKSVNKHLISKYYIKFFLFGFIILIIGILFLVLTINNIIDSFYSFVGYVFTPLGGLMLFVMLMSFVLSKKSYKPAYQFESQCILYDDKLEINVKSATTSSNSILTYSQISKIIIQQNIIYIYEQNSTAFILKKEDNFNELINILKTKVKNIIE